MTTFASMAATAAAHDRYFTFNGAECSTPAAIDGIVYLENGNKSGAQRQLHRVRQIESPQGHSTRGILGW